MIKEANYSKTEIEKEETEFQETMRLYGEDAYSQQYTNPVTVMETIFKMWEDIGRPDFKFFKENMYSEIEASYLYHLLEEIITRHEETIIDDSLDRRELKEKRMDTLYDYCCWNLKLIDIENFRQASRAWKDTFTRRN